MKNLIFTNMGSLDQHFEGNTLSYYINNSFRRYICQFIIHINDCSMRMGYSKTITVILGLTFKYSMILSCYISFYITLIFHQYNIFIIDYKEKLLYTMLFLQIIYL